MRRIRIPKFGYNWITATGSIISFVIILLMTFLYVIDIFASHTNPYVGIFLYMALPPILVFGLILIPAGILRYWWKSRKGLVDSHTPWPSIDFNLKSHRKTFFWFLFGLILFLAISSVGSYQAYHFTESVTFCGKTCHSVMKPEYAAYQNSPHARVACVECHVGTGADWYAKSKLSGLYQVYAVMADKYPRPIPTPIENLRPARETCEKCHWPGKFFGAQQRIFDHYMYDEKNTNWPINLLVKTGGGDPTTGLMSGIHWHTFISNQIEYIARDEQSMDIPWVRATDVKTGRKTIYQNGDEPLTQAEIDSAEIHVLDCMDCHNRPSHIYNAPDRAIDGMLQVSRIDKTLPEIKRVAVEAMAAEYETEEEALHQIANYIIEFYLNEYPDVYKERRDDIDQAVLATQKQFSQNIFPEMKVSWENYPDNIGHFYNPGCMRCHEGKHISDNGEMISTSCYSCHIILAQGDGERAQMATSEEGLEFIHPEDIDEAWKEMGCYECHSGTQP